MNKKLTPNDILKMMENEVSLNEDVDFCEAYMYDLLINPLRDAVGFPAFRHDHGVSKLVLIFDSLDFVIKIPFKGDSCGDYSYETRKLDSNDQTVRDSNGCTCYTYRDAYPTYDGQFTCANNFFEENSEWDYCETESRVYNASIDHNIDTCLAKTWCIGNIDGYPIYAQEKAVMFTSYEARDTIRSHKSTKEMNELRQKLWNSEEYQTELPCTEWCLDFINFYGEEKLKTLSGFLSKYNLHDFHDGNIGYIGMRPVLVDYSSWDS